MQETVTSKEVFETFKIPKETVAQSDIDDIIDDFNDLLYEYYSRKEEFPIKYRSRLPSPNYVAKRSYSKRIYIRTYDEYLALVRDYNKLLKLYLKMPEYLSECLEEEELEKLEKESSDEFNNTLCSIVCTGAILLTVILFLLQVFGVIE
jgi:hypothetical protein